MVLSLGGGIVFTLPWQLRIVRLKNGFECIRRIIDHKNWILRNTGRALSEFEFLPVNERKDLWFETTWKPERNKERFVKVIIEFSNNYEFHTRIRYMYGFLNIGVERVVPVPNAEIIKQIASAIPIIIPSAAGPEPHEEKLSLAQIHKSINIRQPNRIIRNILLELQKTENLDAIKNPGAELRGMNPYLVYH